MSASPPVAVVTGASRGIGFAVARELGSAGHRIVAIARDESRLATAARELEAAGIDVETVAADLADRGAIDALGRDLAERHAAVTALVNNAGATDLRLGADVEPEEWDWNLALNLTAPQVLSRALAPALARAGGSIVNVGSVTGLMAARGLSAYGAAKAGLHHLTRVLALELGPSGVRVNAVAPGFIATELFDSHHPPERQAALARAHGLGRVGTAEEVAAVVGFLCSPSAGFVSGAVLPVDGGLTARLAIPDLA